MNVKFGTARADLSYLTFISALCSPAIQKKRIFGPQNLLACCAVDGLQINMSKTMPDRDVVYYRTLI